MFMIAKPVFPKGKSEELNVYAVFRTTVGRVADAELRITAFGFYRVCVNGRFVGFGPARTARGYARVDRLPIGVLCDRDENEVTIEVSGYCCYSLSTVKQHSYLLAEIYGGGEVLAATGRDFACYLSERRVQAVERYSVQRHFSEVWDLSKPLACEERRVETEIYADRPSLLPRRVGYPEYTELAVSRAASCGRLVPDAGLPVQREFYSFPADAFWGSFPREEIAYHPYEWIQEHRQEKTNDASALPLALREGEYAIIDLGRIETGFLMLDVFSTDGADVAIGFSEDSSPERFAFTDMHAHNAMECLFPAGERVRFASFEPYVLRFAILAVRRGSVTVNSFGMRTFERKTVGARIPDTEDKVLRDICKSAVRTFAHNALDIYMDCPSRERAGWLCDSYFTGQVEYELFGNTEVEDAFLENFRLYRNAGEYPEGVLPMCYPSDPQIDHKFIPQWTMWYILEVEQYLNHRNRKVNRELFRPGIEGLIKFYRRYENADGLLEDLPSWNFVEWSVANQWTKNVSYPTNLLYAEALECVYRLWGDKRFLTRAAQIRETVLEQSFNGELFMDHAVRDASGKLVLQNDCSEACQYYAMLFGKYDWKSEQFDKLRHLVTEVFGSRRAGQRPDVAEVNAFIGAYLRLEALLAVGEYDLVPGEVKFFFGQMSDETKTLWEYRQRHGSRDHGFASYALVALRRAMDRA